MNGGYLRGSKRPYQSLVPFEDVIMCFSGEEWKHLTMTQTLYAEVTMENIALTSSLCYQRAVEDEEIPCEQVSEKPCMCGEPDEVTDPTDLQHRGSPNKEKLCKTCKHHQPSHPAHPWTSWRTQKSFKCNNSETSFQKAFSPLSHLITHSNRRHFICRTGKNAPKENLTSVTHQKNSPWSHSSSV